MLRGRAAAARPPALPGLRHALARRGAAPLRSLHRSTRSGWHLTAQAGTRNKGTGRGHGAARSPNLLWRNRRQTAGVPATGASRRRARTPSSGSPAGERVRMSVMARRANLGL